MSDPGKKRLFGTAPVFLTAISTILGAILFLRFGYANGVLGIWGVFLIILIGHLVTIPTAFALSEIATNQKVKGGGEYFIISRSFGMNIGTTIGISLYLSQAISVAFYVIAFTEAFEPFFNWFRDQTGIMLPRQVISLPTMCVLALIIIRKGAGSGVKILYIVVAVLLISLVLFFLGKTDYHPPGKILSSIQITNYKDFFVVFAIVFPAFTGMTAGVGLSGDLKNPGKSIPLGTISATILGMIIYIFVSWKLYISASPEDLISDQLIMRRIAIMGPLIIPLGLGASTISSAIGSVMVAPRTLQALALDRAFPGKFLNVRLGKSKGVNQEPINASILTVIIAFIFVALGNVNTVAQIISMFFMITYGSLCLISFLFHFGADPSYRPSFRSRWYISLIGFIVCFMIMFKISTAYALVAIASLLLFYLYISNYHKERKGFENIFSNALFQLNRNLQIYLQKKGKSNQIKVWRPSIVCLSDETFERQNALRLLNWIAYKHGFGTYIHLIKDYFSKSAKESSVLILEKLLTMIDLKEYRIYIDTMISPSYTSAIAQVIQLPGISGMENNMILYEFSKKDPKNIKQIVDNFSLVKAANYDVCVLGSSSRPDAPKKELHIWIRHIDYNNANLMIILGYIISGHPQWHRSEIKIFVLSIDEKHEEIRKALITLISEGRLPISVKNIEIIPSDSEFSIKTHINNKSSEASLTLIGFRSEQIKKQGENVFLGFDDIGDILFVNTSELREIY